MNLGEVAAGGDRQHGRDSGDGQGWDRHGDRRGHGRHGDSQGDMSVLGTVFGVAEPEEMVIW